MQTAGVQFILTSVIQALRDNPARKFVYGEMVCRHPTPQSPVQTDTGHVLQAYFTKWWKEQTTATKSEVTKLAAAGQLDFVNGGYVQHDEASAHYVAMIDQTTKGHRWCTR
jgi:alpha-mannosidase